MARLWCLGFCVSGYFGFWVVLKLNRFLRVRSCGFELLLLPLTADATAASLPPHDRLRNGTLTRTTTTTASTTAATATFEWQVIYTREENIYAAYDNNPSSSVMDGDKRTMNVSLGPRYRRRRHCRR